LKELRAEINQLSKQIKNIVDSQYSIERQNESGICIKFANNEEILIPGIKFRDYQVDIERKLFVDGVKRIFTVWPRRSGKEVMSWNILVEAALQKTGLYLMIYPTNVRARKILWAGAITFPDGTSLRFLDMIPEKLIESINNQEMSIKLINGSIINILGSDKAIDKLRGTNPLGVVLSEWAFSDPRVWYTLMPIFRQNDGWAIIQTTYNGMNHAYRYMQEVRENPIWYCRVESVETLRTESGNRYITDAMIDEDRKSGMPEWMIQQEYYSKVELNQDTLYFSVELNNIYETNRIKDNLIIPGTNAYAFYDIGWNDNTAVIIVQINEYGKYNIIHYFQNNNKIFEYYVTECRRFCNKHNLLLHSHYVPHDGQKHEFGSGKNVVDFAHELGEKCYIVPAPSSKINAIQSMRQMLYKCNFEKENTRVLIDCLSNYTKEFDEKKGVYKNNAVHNWASHGVDAFQTFTLAIEGRMIVTKSHDIVYMQ